jgi:hypothetical protein
MTHPVVPAGRDHRLHGDSYQLENHAWKPAAVKNDCHISAVEDREGLSTFSHIHGGRPTTLRDLAHKTWWAGTRLLIAARAASGSHRWSLRLP